MSNQRRHPTHQHYNTLQEIGQRPHDRPPSRNASAPPLQAQTIPPPAVIQRDNYATIERPSAFQEQYRIQRDRTHSNGSEEILQVPVWTDRNSNSNPNGYYPSGGEEENGASPSPRIPSTTSTPTFQNQHSITPAATANEAFRLIDSGVDAENEGRYKVARRFFLEAAEMLQLVSEGEKDVHVESLLIQKAEEILGWTENLDAYIRAGQVGPPPERKGRAVLVNVAGRLRGDVAEITGAEDMEFNTLHYTACSTKSPANFAADGYRLQCLQNGRRPQLMVVITMYNEDKQELMMTLRKVANNIKEIQAKRLPGYEGEDAWKNILVCIVSDGRKKANAETLSFLKEVGLFDYDAMNINMRGIDTQCHLFEFSVQFMNHKKLFFGLHETNTQYPPMQVIFALKEHNAGKLNSHEWYFNAFAEQILPEYTVLLDVGTLPTKTAFARLLMAMEMNPQIGGTCGEIAVDRPIPNLCNPIILAQHFEYKISNIMDKAFESCFGFISVLPGAFSAYRYRAIRGEPLRAYFKSLTTPMNELGPFQGNMYLAEDRILCFELLARKNCAWTMHYVKDAIARTDVPVDLVSLINQRRRWLNGSFFALVYVVLNWGRVYTESSHSYIRKACLYFQYAFMVINLVLNWFLPSNFFLVLYYLLIVGLREDRWGVISTKNWSSSVKNIVINLFYAIYGVIFLMQLIIGLGNKPKRLALTYNIIAVIYALFMLGAVVVVVGLILIQIFPALSDQPSTVEENFEAADLVAASAGIGVFFVAAALHLELHHIMMSFVQYFALLPTFVNVLSTYSFCNLHDLSWGTKGLESSAPHGPVKPAAKQRGGYQDAVEAERIEQEKKEKQANLQAEMTANFQVFRSNLLLFWLLANLAFACTVIELDPDGLIYLVILFYTVAIFNMIRLIGSVMFLLYHYRQSFCMTCGVRRKMKKRLNDRRKRYAEALDIQTRENQHREPLV